MEHDLEREASGGEAGDELTSLRAHSLEDAAEIARLESDAGEARRIERSQQALIARLRQDVGETDERLQQVRDRLASAESELNRLASAESELNDLRAIRDALSSPALLQRTDLTLAAELIPASSQVGGDFFFVGDGPGGAVVAIIGDVVGKGLPAARRAAFTRTAFASVAPFADDPCRLLELVNVALVERIGESADFVTAACVTYHPASRTLRAASAGHPPPLRLDLGDELQIATSGRALGLGSTIGCTAVTEQLSPGAGILLYTDGLIEARGAQTRYGINRTVGAIRDQTGTTPIELISHLIRDVQTFAGQELTDDICLIAFRTRT